MNLASLSGNGRSILLFPAVASLLGLLAGTPLAGGSEEYLVTLPSHSSADRSSLEEVFSGLGLEKVEALETDQPIYLLRFRPDPGLKTLRERARSAEGIKRVQPNYPYAVPEPPRSPEPQPVPESSPEP